MNHRPQGRTATAGLLAACLMTASACGSGGGSGQSASSGGEDIVVGVLEPLSGGFSGPGTAAVNAVQLAVDHINADGGIKSLGGRKLRVVKEDSTTTDANKASSAASQLLKEKPAFVVGPFVSAVALPATTVFERAQVPTCVASFSDQLTQRGYKYLFELPPTATDIGNKAVQAFQEVVPLVAPNATKVAAVYDSNPGQAVVAAFAKSLQAAGKYQVVLDQQFPSGATNLTPLAQNIKSSGAEVLVPGTTTAEIEQLLGSLGSLGAGQVPIFNPGGGSPSTTDYVKTLKSLVNGQFVIPLWDYDMKLSDEQNKLLKRANDDFTKKNPDQPFMDQFAGEDYVCTQVMAQGLEKAKSTNGQAIRDAISGATFSSGPASLMPPGKVHFNSAGLNDAAVPLVSEWCQGLLRTVAPQELASMKPRSPQECGRNG